MTWASAVATTTSRSEPSGANAFWTDLARPDLPQLARLPQSFKVSAGIVANHEAVSRPPPIRNRNIAGMANSTAFPASTLSSQPRLGLTSAIDGIWRTTGDRRVDGGGAGDSGATRRRIGRTGPEQHALGCLHAGSRKRAASRLALGVPAGGSVQDVDERTREARDHVAALQAAGLRDLSYVCHGAVEGGGASVGVD
jgi:hypothetical protein